MERTRIKQSIVVLAVGVALSLGLALTKLFVGLSCNSLCILMDSTNSFFDIGTGIVSIVAFCLLLGRKSERHPFGWGRSEYLAGFVVSAVIIVMSGVFLLQSLNRLSMPEPVYFGIRNCILICVAWGVKVGMTLFYYFANRRIQSKALRALLMDSIGDVGVTTVSVVSFAVSTRLSYAVDAWLGIVVSIALFVYGIRLVVENVSLLLGRGDVDEELQLARDALCARPTISRVVRVRLHDYGYRNKYGYAEVVSSTPDISTFLSETAPVKEALAERGVYLEIIPIQEDEPPRTQEEGD